LDYFSPKIKKRLIIYSFWIFALVNVICALFGLYSIFLLLLCLFGILGICEQCLERLKINKNTILNIRLFVLLGFGIVLIAEISLRFDSTLDSYMEKMGSLFYISPYHHQIKPSKSWIHNRKPNSEKHQSQTEYEYEIISNDEGLRDINHPVNKKKNEIRIIALGDSFTEGIGVRDLKNTWVKILEHNLENRFAGKTITIFNAGVSSSDPFFEFVLLKQKLLKYNPDIVLICINQSDIYETIVRGGYERFIENNTVKFNTAPWFEPVFGMSYLVRLFFVKILNLDWMFLTSIERINETELAISKIGQCIDDLQMLGDENGFKTVMIIQPVSEDLEINVKGKSNIKNVFPVNSSVLTLDMINFFKSNNVGCDIDDFFWPIDRHFTKKGNLLFAFGVEEYLMKSGVLRYFQIQIAL